MMHKPKIVDTKTQFIAIKDSRKNERLYKSCTYVKLPRLMNKGIMKTLSFFDISDSRTHVGLVQFNEQAQVVAKLDGNNDEGLIHDYLMYGLMPTGKMSFVEAFKAAREDVLGKGGRLMMPKLCLLFTAGCTGINFEETLAEAQKLKFFCSLFVVTTDTNDFRRSFYEQLATKSQLIIAEANQLSTAVDGIAHQLCPSQLDSHSKL